MPDFNTDTDLLALSQQIRETEHSIASANRRSERSNWTLILGPLLGLFLYAIFWIDVIPIDVRNAIYYPAIPIAVLCAVATVYLKSRPGCPVPRTGIIGRQFVKLGDLELTLARLKDQRTLLLSRRDTGTHVRRVAYKEEAFFDIDKLRNESNQYRRVNNTLQGILIIGSISATATSGLMGEHPFLRWVTLALTLTVGISSGFSGYFKYKERGFYLKQTADAIESEWEAVDIGIGRYRRHGQNEEEALAEFVEEVHRLKSEQKKREQNLDQPAETRTGSE